MSVPTTDKFVRSATSDAINSACFSLLEQLDVELRDSVLTENNELAEKTLDKMIVQEDALAVATEETAETT